MISHSATTQLSFETVWSFFLTKIEHPEAFVPGVSDVQILENSAEYVMRKMNLTAPDGKVSLVIEKITHTDQTVRYTLIDHPVYTGFVDNTAERLSATETRVTFTMVWNNKETGEAFHNQALIEQAVTKTISYMEEESIKR